MAEKKKTELKNYSPIKLEILITVVPKSKGEFFQDYIQGFESNLQLRLLGNGTADNEMLRKLGLEGNDKSVIISIIKSTTLQDCLEGLEDKFSSIKGGKGIAWTIPIDSLIGVLVYKFLSNNRDNMEVSM